MKRNQHICTNKWFLSSLYLGAWRIDWFDLTRDPLRSENSLIVLKICCCHRMDFPVGFVRMTPHYTACGRSCLLYARTDLDSECGHTLKYTGDCARYSSWLFWDAMNSTEGVPPTCIRIVPGRCVSDSCLSDLFVMVALALFSWLCRLLDVASWESQRRRWFCPLLLE
jgi:hypothetical protein